MNMKISTQKIALMGILGAQALALSFMENLIPTMPFLPPGVKLGLANIVTMFCAGTMGFIPAMIITVLKSGFAFLTRGATAFMMSFGGGLLSTVAMCVLVRKSKKFFGYIGIAVISAICHNIGQLSVSILISKTTAMLYYTPVLLISGIITGVLTGVILKTIMPLLNKQRKFFNKGS